LIFKLLNNTVICPVLLRLNDNNTVNTKTVIHELEDIISESYVAEKKFEDFKSDWKNRITVCARLLNLELVRKVKLRIYERQVD
jgi:hypothetical protein